MSLLRLAVVVTFAVPTLLYEISYIMLSVNENINNIEELRSFGLNNYTVIEGDIFLTIFKHTVGWEIKKEKVQWVQVKTLDDVLASVRNNTVKYVFSFDLMEATIFRCGGLCDAA